MQYIVLCSGLPPAILGLYMLVWWRLVAQITGQGQNAYLAGQSI